MNEQDPIDLTPVQPSTDEIAAAFWKDLKERRTQQAEYVKAAPEALERLATAMRPQSGGSYKLRSLLFSLYNGRPTDLNDIVSLDWNLRSDFMIVMMAFGWESPSGHDSFFYNQLEAAIVEEGIWEWFTDHSPVEWPSPSQS